MSHLITALFILSFNLLIFWVVASAGTSLIKIAKDDCDKRYKIESVVSGDWFCSKDK